MINQKQAAKAFVERWKAEEGNEDRQARSFWIEFTQKVLGIDDPTYVLDFERKVKGRKIDVFYEDIGILIEMKSRGVDLDKKSERSKKAGEETPYQQAKWYADNLPNSVRPDWIIVSNFDEFRIHNLDTDDPEHEYVSITLDELPDQIHLFSFFTDKSSSRLVKEKELSVKAGEIVGRLYKSLAAQYKNIETDRHEQRSLNILIVRFVFLLYAEDAGILQEHQAFLNYMRNVEPEDMRTALLQLFEILDTPEDQRDPYLSEKLAAFPYINGSLFSKEDIVIPQFTQQIKYDLLKEASQEFDWSGISPTIFGAAFESTLNPDTRREGGMHYTSIENIHKVIDPLFLDDLKAELADIEGEKVEKKRILRLKQFQKKLASIKILDPACGSGNFLTESYLSLRKLENRILESLQGGNMALGFEGEHNPIQVSIDQFYGIEINDFAVAVAKTALWIAEEQMMDVTQEILFRLLDFLPLSSNDNIHEGNALRMDWNDVLPAEQCSYIIGNPPFLGSSTRKPEQTADLEVVFGDEKKWGKCDYCVGWYIKSADYMETTDIKTALVSTNSITQGEQVAPTWKRLFERGIHIIFAWRTFIWNNEATDQAHVHCVIIGFSYLNPKVKYIFSDDGTVIEVSNINGYLVDADNLFLPSRTAAPDNEHKAIVQGSKPVDGGGLILSIQERDDFLRQYPDLEDLIHSYLGAEDYIKNKPRYCFWLKNIDPRRYETNPIIRERLEIVRAQRENSPTEEFRKCSITPHLFVQDRSPDDDYLMIPRVSSSRREYIPVGYLDKDIIPSDSAYIIPSASLYDFGLVTSKMHNYWLATVAGRLKSDFRYSPVVYNTFIYPNPTTEQKNKIEQLAQSILDIRDSYPDKSLADLYDPDKMPSDLLQTHKSLDRAVEEAYGVDFNGDEEKIVSHLFKLYAEASKE